MGAVGLSVVLLAASALFVAFITAHTFNVKVCAVCAAFTSVWLGLLGLTAIGLQVDPVLIGILMGGSVVGSYYFIRDKLPEEYQIFTFTYLATLFSLAYFVLRGGEHAAYVVLAALWAVFVGVFLLRYNPAWKGAARKLIECCKNW